MKYLTQLLAMLSSSILITSSCSSITGGGNSNFSALCPDSPAPQAFDHTVCICEDFRDIGNLIVGRSITTDDASLAVNGHTVALNNTDVRGDFIAYGGLEAKANVGVAANLSSADTVDAIGNIEVGADMDVGGNLAGAGRLAVDGTLRIGGADNFIGFKQTGATEAYGTTPPAPCGCDDSQIVDVVSEVEAARGQNDNAAVGLPTEVSDIGYSVLQFGSGTYFFDKVETIGATKLIIDGTVSIYIAGNLDNIGAQWIRLMPGATLDLYVSGAVRNVGHVELGDKNAPSSFRLYIGGTEEVSLNIGNQLFNGAIYAPRAVLRYIGNTNVRGAIFAKEIVGTGNLVVGYAAPGEPPEGCDDPEVETPEEEPETPPEEDDPIVVQ